MDEPLIVRRDIDLDLPADDLWTLVAGGWEEWLVDAADVTVEPGGGGVVRDDDEDREVRIAEVVDGERISFEWWPLARPQDRSAVEMVVLPTPAGAVLRVTESFLPHVQAQASMAAIRWEVRAVAAWASAAVSTPA
jgi:uncharacterized protein YndB with AHSA1/START domain